MDSSLVRRMVFHGAVIVLLGLVAGLAYALVLTGGLAGSERAWRAAHLEAVLNGLLVIAVGAAGPLLALRLGRQRLLAVAMVGMGYANTAAASLAAVAGVRGLEPGGSVANTLVYLLFLLAVLGVLIGLGLVAAGARGAVGRGPAPAGPEPDGPRAR